MADVYLTQRDIDYISRVVATEVPASLKQTDPAEYSRMVNAVTDTMINRVASESYPDTITGVANQSRQFSKITGPERLDPYGSVQAAPKASQEIQSMVAGRVADLAQGAESEINGALSYANPKSSDASNLAEWVNPMIEAGALKLGLGDMVHYHGLAPGQESVQNVNVSAEGIPSGGIPVPYGPNDDPFANSLQAQAVDGFSGLANPVSTRDTVQRQDLPASTTPAGEWGVRNGVVPSYYPTVNTWADIANAPPVSSPMGSVQAEGLLGGVPGLEAQARAAPMMSIPASAVLGATPGLSASAIAGQEPAFDQSRFDGLAPSVADIDASRFSTPAKTNRIGTQEMADLSRLSPLSGVIDPATNTQSFMDAPHQPVNVDTRGLLATTPGFDATTTASVASAPTISNPAMQTPNFAQAMMPSIPSMNTFGAQPNVSAPMSSIATSQQQAAGYQQAANTMAQAGILNIGQQPPTDLSGNLPANLDVLGAAPSLETVSVPEQPTIAAQPTAVDGPTTTPAVTQQRAIAADTMAQPSRPQPTVQSAQNTKSFRDSLLSKETAIGGLLGAATFGPVGGILGALAGQRVAANGGLTGLLSSGFSPPTNQIGGGVANIGGIYNGMFSPGTYAVANNGATITAQPNGYTSYTNKYGVNETVSPSGQISHNFGSIGDFFGGSDTPDPNATI